MTRIWRVFADLIRLLGMTGPATIRLIRPIRGPFLQCGDCALATIYSQLGIDPRLAIADQFNRPIHILPRGEPWRELLST